MAQQSCLGQERESKNLCTNIPQPGKRHTADFSSPCPRTHILSNSHTLTHTALILGSDPLLASEALPTRQMQGGAEDVWVLVL